jgi:hypothetical protein
MALKRWLRGVMWFVLLLASALLLLIAAWLASNWHDAPPQPRPEALQLPTPSLPDDRNAYFALAGLRAAADRDPGTAGQTVWKQQLASAAEAQGRLAAPAGQAPANGADSALGTPLPSMAGPPLVCNEPMDACVAQWIDNPDALSAQRKEHVLLGQRCDRLLEGDLQFEEALAPMRTVAEPMAQHGVGASDCSKWFLSGAVIAWAQQDRPHAIALLTKADRMNRALLGGSHSLIGQMIAVRVTRNTFGVVSALAVREPSLGAALMPLLAPLPDAVQSAKRWMVVEAAFQRGSITEMAALSDEQAATVAGGGEATSGGFDLLAGLFRRHIGWHPERTAQAIDAQWLRSMRQLDNGLAAAIEAQSSEAAADSASNGLWHGVTWVNPVGSVLVNVALPSFAGYLARQADLALHRETAAVAVTAASADVPSAERRAWLAQQPRSPLARERIAWSDDGLALVARTWQETSVPHVQPPPRDAIRIPLPSSR